MKLSFLSLGFSSLILLASCTKEEAPPATGTNPDDYPTTVNVSTSDWTAASSMTWSDETVSSDGFATTNWVAPRLSQEMVDNGAVLIYAKTSSSDDAKLLPAMFQITSDSEYDEYRGVAESKVIHLSHATYREGTYVTPSSNRDISFRYILIDNIPTTHGRFITSNGMEYSLTDLRLMSYTEVAFLLGITQ